MPEKDRELCAQAARALERLQQSFQRPTPEETRLRNAAELALAAQRATEQLRASGLSELLAERRALSPSAPSASGSAPPPPSSAPAATSAPKAPASAPSAPLDPHAHAHAQEHQNPTLDAILAYGRLASLALRTIATYLEHGPPETRRRALAELTRLADARPRWSALAALVKEARLVEADPELERKLEGLESRLRDAR